MLSRQIKFWVFGVIGAVGIYLTLRGLGTDFYISIGLSLIVGAIGAMILGSVWDATRDSEKAATYRREARDEEARQEYLATKAKGAKQLENHVETKM